MRLAFALLLLTSIPSGAAGPAAGNNCGAGALLEAIRRGEGLNGDLDNGRSRRERTDAYREAIGKVGDPALRRMIDVVWFERSHERGTPLDPLAALKAMAAQLRNGPSQEINFLLSSDEYAEDLDEASRLGTPSGLWGRLMRALGARDVPFLRAKWAEAWNWHADLFESMLSERDRAKMDAHYADGPRGYRISGADWEKRIASVRAPPAGPPEVLRDPAGLWLESERRHQVWAHSHRANPLGFPTPVGRAELEWMARQLEPGEAAVRAYNGPGAGDRHHYYHRILGRMRELLASNDIPYLELNELAVHFTLASKLADPAALNGPFDWMREIGPLMDRLRKAMADDAGYLPILVPTHMPIDVPAYNATRALPIYFVDFTSREALDRDLQYLERQAASDRGVFGKSAARRPEWARRYLIKLGRIQDPELRHAVERMTYELTRVQGHSFDPAELLAAMSAGRNPASHDDLTRRAWEWHREFFSGLMDGPVGEPDAPQRDTPRARDRSR